MTNQRRFAGAWGILLLVASATATGAAAPLALVPIGQPLPDVTLSGLNGPPRALSSYRGRPLLINVWASYCGPCRAEAASLERLAWSEAGARYTIIGVSIDDERAAALGWLRQSNATISHYLDSRLTMETLLGAQTVPLTVLVDANGRVVQRFHGARDWYTPESIRMLEQVLPPAKKTAK